MGIAVLSGRAIGEHSALDIAERNLGILKYRQFSGKTANDCTVENLKSRINVFGRQWTVSGFMADSICKRLA